MKEQSKKVKSYLELKIVCNNLTELRLLENHYMKLGFVSDGFSQDNGELYWMFLKQNNGLIEEPKKASQLFGAVILNDLPS